MLSGVMGVVCRVRNAGLAINLINTNRMPVGAFVSQLRAAWSTLLLLTY